MAVSDIHGRTIGKMEKIAQDYDLLLIAGDITHFGGYAEAKNILDSLAANNCIAAIYGNCDHKEVGNYLNDAGISVHAKTKEAGGHYITGFSGAPKSPFNTPGEFNDKEIGSGIIPADPAREIVLTHVPPYDTKVDLTGPGHIGSRSLRSYIEKYQPILNICGHVHEARGHDLIGRTQIINPGPYYLGYYVEIRIGKSIEYEFKTF
ncbi:MAG: metallophosphoesterase [Candidatus Methanofastidiosia archaeon]